MTDVAWQQQRAWVEIDSAALIHNLQQINSLLAPATEVTAVVKADAYGHGAIEVAQVLLAHGAQSLAVATVPEGIELRQQGIRAPILLLGAAHSGEQIAAIARWGLEPTVVDLSQALALQRHLQQPIPVHLKLDTGMSRLGTDFRQADEFCRAVLACDHLRVASIYSHLATADELDDRVWEQQRRFVGAIEAVRPLFSTLPQLHLANSAGILVDRAFHFDRVRPGLLLYGLAPAAHGLERLDLRPALTVRARVTQVKTILAGTGVSYGHRFVAPRDMRVGVVGIGYADGVPRRLSQALRVQVREQWVPQLGAITMDQIIVDLSTVPEVAVGEIVTLLGAAGVTAADWAAELGTISWEILCGFKHRLPRLWA